MNDKDEAVELLKREISDLNLKAVEKDSVLAAETEQLNEQIGSFKDKLQEAKSEVTSTRRKQLEASNQLQSAVIRCDKLVNEKQHLQSQLAESESKSNNVISQLDAANSIIASSKNKETECRARTDLLNLNLKKKDEERELMERNLKEKESEIEGLKRAVAPGKRPFIFTPY